MPRTLVIGRSPFADVVVADASVAPHHLELVIADNGRVHATDCATQGGTWQMPSPSRHGSTNAATTGAAAEGWVRVRQAFVTPQTPLRLGEYCCTVGELLARARKGPPPAAAGEAAGETRLSPARGGLVLRGRVERDAATGEIVRRRP